jgi:hypothetical protein
LVNSRVVVTSKVILPPNLRYGTYFYKLRDTGFKLQRATIDNILVVENREGHRHWIYVLLSRVKTLEGLFLRKPIPTNPDHYMVPPELAMMLQDLDERCACPAFDENDLEDYRE